MESLYVCLFSNGHIKVGRSIDPKSRIASHVDRVACIGIELVEHSVVECAGHAGVCEAELVSRCVVKCAQRHKNEWFAGLDYETVCVWAREASQVSAVAQLTAMRRIRQALGMTQSALAVHLGCTQGNVVFYEQGRTVLPEVAKRLIRYARSRGLPLSYEDIYGDPESTADHGERQAA